MMGQVAAGTGKEPINSDYGIFDFGDTYSSGWKTLVCDDSTCQAVPVKFKRKLYKHVYFSSQDMGDSDPGKEASLVEPDKKGPFFFLSRLPPLLS